MTTLCDHDDEFDDNDQIQHDHDKYNHEDQKYHALNVIMIINGHDHDHVNDKFDHDDLTPQNTMILSPFVELVLNFRSTDSPFF